jgi:hypothetical protein
MAFVPHAVVFAAFSAIVVGLWWIYPPAGLIGGGALVLLDIIHGRMRARRPDDS